MLPIRRDDTDSDNDGIADRIEINISLDDTDGDGIIDVFDADIENNGEVGAGKEDTNFDGLDDRRTNLAIILATNSGDTDLDGIPNPFDADADGDLTTDLGVVDDNLNGVIDDLQSAHELLRMINGDSDIAPNHLDFDADNDGLTDVSESSSANRDVDGDAFVDAGQPLINDSSDLSDADGEGEPDYLDRYSADATDSVASSRDILTSAEFGSFADTLDTDRDGEVDDITDTDNDGAVDAVDNFTTGFGANNDVDGDGIPNDEDLVPGGTDIVPNSGVLFVSPVLLLMFAGLLMLKLRRRVLRGCVLVFGMALSVFTQAEHNTKWQLGLAIGMSTLDPKGAGSIELIDDRDMAYQFGVGYHLNERWLTELRYVDLGEASVEGNGNEAAIEYDTIGLNTQYHWQPFANKQFGVYVLGGATRVAAMSSGVTFEEGSSTEIQLGFGATYTKHNYQLFTEYSSYRGDAGAFVFGVHYQL